MEKVLALVIGMLLIWLIWRKLVVPTLLLKTRNDLFDLRDTLRDEFLASGKSLNDKSYLAIRASINSRLQFVENVTYWKMIYFSYWAKSNDETVVKIGQRLNSKFRTDNDALNSRVLRIRREANSVVLTYTIFTSFFALTTALLISLAVTVINFCGSIFHLVSSGVFILSNVYKLIQKICTGIHGSISHPIGVTISLLDASANHLISTCFVYKQRGGLVEDLTATPFHGGAKFAG
jgi:hypothetical protein